MSNATKLDCLVCEESQTVCDDCIPYWFDCDMCAFTFPIETAIKVGGDYPYIPHTWLVCVSCNSEYNEPQLSPTNNEGASQ